MATLKDPSDPTYDPIEEARRMAEIAATGATAETGWQPLPEAPVPPAYTPEGRPDFTPQAAPERNASVVDFTPAAPAERSPASAVERYLAEKDMPENRGSGGIPGQYLPTGQQTPAAQANLPQQTIAPSPWGRGEGFKQPGQPPMFASQPSSGPEFPNTYGRGLPPAPDWMKGIGEFASEAFAPTLGTPMGPGIAGAGAGLGSGFLGAVGRRLLPSLTGAGKAIVNPASEGAALKAVGAIGGGLGLGAGIGSEAIAPAPPTPGPGYAGGGRVVPGVNAPALEPTETPAGPGTTVIGEGTPPGTPGSLFPGAPTGSAPTGAPAPAAPGGALAPYSGPLGAPVSGLPPMFPAVAPATDGGGAAIPGTPAAAKPAVGAPAAPAVAPATGGGGGAAPTFGTSPTATATGPGTSAPFGAGPAQAVDLAGMTQQMGADLQSLRQMVQNPAAPPDVIGMYVQGLQMIMATLDKSEQSLRAEFAKNNSEIDPATQTVLNQLRETLKLDLKNTAEELNARGLYSSGILLDLEQKLRKGALSEESKVLNQRLTSMRDQLNASLTNISNQRFSSASSFGMAGIQGQQQANEAADANRQNLIQLIAQQQMAMRGQLSQENQSAAQMAAQQSQSDRAYGLDQQQLAEQQRQYNESFGMDKAKYNQDYAQREQQAALDRQNQLQIAGMPSRSSSGSTTVNAYTRDAIDSLQSVFPTYQDFMASYAQNGQTWRANGMQLGPLMEAASRLP